ncbi:unnamed protein product [Thlaspi arvense]|uniref:Uncharacterized protein n=1 Tax=Thlaspi arvense TaxID=13288 RepID=A0AAU9RRJ7_THLAR|nr:unnamed protein product [Thlaspi arvense]
MNIIRFNEDQHYVLFVRLTEDKRKKESSRFKRSEGVSPDSRLKSLSLKPKKFVYAGVEYFQGTQSDDCIDYEAVHGFVYADAEDVQGIQRDG